MPLLMLWGHGSFRTSYGYFKVPNNVELHFFVPDNSPVDDDAIRNFEFGDLSHGVSDDLVAKARKVQGTFARTVMTSGDSVKNYRLESVIGDILAPGAKNALKNNNVWTPGKETNDGEAEAYLVDIVRGQAHLGSAAAPMVVQWCACTSNYVGSDEATAPVSRGKKIKDPNASCCYITTATCSALGLPDDCEPLSKLRWFRDHVVLRTARGVRDIRTYYDTAPEIVRAIERERDRAAIYRAIYHGFLAPALAAIDRKDYASAYRWYGRLFAGLQRRYLRR